MAEGWAASPERADAQVSGGEVRLEAANHHGTVIAMAGAVGPGTPVFVVENPQGGNRSFSPVNQGPAGCPGLGSTRRTRSVTSSGCETRRDRSSTRP